jgi:hypothetical protein
MTACHQGFPDLRLMQNSTHQCLGTWRRWIGWLGRRYGPLFIKICANRLFFIGNDSSGALEDSDIWRAPKSTRNTFTATHSTINKDTQLSGPYLRHWRWRPQVRNSDKSGFVKIHARTTLPSQGSPIVQFPFQEAPIKVVFVKSNARTAFPSQGSPIVQFSLPRSFYLISSNV